MQTTGRISLSPQDILSLKSVKGGMERKSLRRFKALVEGAPVPLHVPPANPHRKPGVAITPLEGQPMLANSIQMRGGEDEILKVISAGWLGPDLSLSVQRDYRVGGIHSLPFADVARAGAFELEAISCVLNPASGKLYLSGIGPLASAPIKPGMLQAGIWEAWPSIAREIAGIEEGAPSYKGAMVGVKGRPGIVTIAGIVESHEIPMKGTSILWNPGEVSAYISEFRDKMDPRLMTALVISGYNEWGHEFLKKADK